MHNRPLFSRIVKLLTTVCEDEEEEEEADEEANIFSNEIHILRYACEWNIQNEKKMK